MNKFLASLKKIGKNNIFLFILSIFISFGLWLFVTTDQNSEINQTFSAIEVDTSIDDTVPENEGLMLTQNKKYYVNITVTGKRNELMKLSSKKSEIKATADYTAVNKEGTYSVPVDISFPINGVALSNDRPTISLEFDKKDTQQIPVKVITTGTIKDEFFISNEEITVSPLYIEVTGPSKKLNQIMSARCVVDVTDQKETISTNSKYTFVSVSDEEINDSTITVDYDKVDVKIPVYKYKEVPFAVNLVNSSGGNDSKFAIVTMNPTSIKIAGSESQLANINQILLDIIDMSTVPDVATFEMNIMLPNDIVNVEKTQKVSVKVESKNVVTKTFEVNKFNIINPPAGQNCSVETKKLNVSVRGPQEYIDKLNSDNISVTVDLKGKELVDGKNRVSVSMKYPDDYLVGTVGKYTVIVDAE